MLIASMFTYYACANKLVDNGQNLSHYFNIEIIWEKNSDPSHPRSRKCIRQKPIELPLEKILTKSLT